MKLLPYYQLKYYLDKWRIWNIFLDDFVCAFQKQCFIRRHFVEDNFLNRWFSASGIYNMAIKFMLYSSMVFSSVTNKIHLSMVYLLRPIKRILGLISSTSSILFWLMTLLLTFCTPSGSPLSSALAILASISFANLVPLPISKFAPLTLGASSTWIQW